MLFDDIKTEQDLERLKRRIMRDENLYVQIKEVRKKIYPPEYKIAAASKLKLHASSSKKEMPTNAEILALYREMVKSGEQKESKEAEAVMRKIKTRSNSGVAVVSLLTKPFACPGRCVYCPTEDNMPKSYLSLEPAAARALANDFDPYMQVTNRLHALMANGHPTDKVEMIVIGGTWSFYHPAYQEEFISECFRACNNFGAEKVIEKDEKNLSELQEINENAKCRMIGLSIETRPDYITGYELSRLRKLGVTKVEIGVQHLDNDILRLTNRDMTREQVAEATEKLRNAGLKVVYHMMPNLPGSNIKKDIAMFSELFSGKEFQPDMLKIYPCMVLEKSELYNTWKQGGFIPYTDEELMEVLSSVKKNIPIYTRIIRVIRDIPASYIKAGSVISNLRQHLIEDQKKNNWQCRCIRCREIRNDIFDTKDFILTKTEYKTTTGKEVFLSFENEKENKLAAFLRLRLPEKVSDDFYKEELAVLKNSALVRELHTYGQLKPIHEKGDQSQHVGLGRTLMNEAEKIAHSAGYKKIAVISGVGVRGYYRKLGYILEGTYMIKYLSY